MKYLSTGEFAALCGIKKDTLFFYDREGLLKPRHVSENGYRRYAVEQFFDYDMIAVLKDTGTSLQEIKRHLKDRDPEELLRLLEEKKRLLRQERERLARRQRMLESIIALAREALQAEHGVLRIVEAKEELLEAVPAGKPESDSPAGFVPVLTEYFDRLERQGRRPDPTYGILVYRDSVLAGQYAADAFFCKASRLTPKEDLHLKPKGRYAVFSHQGTLQTHMEVYRRMLEDIAASGLRVAGNIYAYDLARYFAQKNAEEYAVKYCVHVE